MAMTYPMGTLYVNGTKVAEVTNIEIVGQREAAPLPKPPRVEKWQRWRDQSGIERVVYEMLGDAANIRSAHGSFGIQRAHLLAGQGWTFLGYAKPDKVEVGQRWKHSGGALFVVANVPPREWRYFITRYDGLSGDWWRSIEELCQDFEYLGMADAVSAEEDAIRKCAAATGQPTGSIREAVNDIKQRYEAPPLTGEQLDSLKKALENFVPRDAKAEARRASEEAAKRLIANPPEWAYPRAWMCAVLASTERTRWSGRCETTMMVESFSDGKNGFTYRNIRKYHERRIAGMTHERAIDGLDWIIQVNAYARGMDRPSPRMTRQGVKGGISTCDLGGEYE